MPPEDRARLHHMIETVAAACGFVSGRTRSDLDSDRMIAFPLARAIEIVGEAAGRISAPTREATTEIPWSRIVSMRNRLIHAYFDVDYEIVWQTVTIELPRLLPLLRALAEKAEDAS